MDGAAQRLSADDVLVDCPAVQTVSTHSSDSACVRRPVQHLPTRPELHRQVQWRRRLIWGYRSMRLHPCADRALRVHPPVRAPLRPCIACAPVHLCTSTPLS
eukprot:1474395-Pyramimonas_sp.AAC.1